MLLFDWSVQVEIPSRLLDDATGGVEVVVCTHVCACVSVVELCIYVGLFACACLFVCAKFIFTHEFSSY